MSLEKLGNDGSSKRKSQAYIAAQTLNDEVKNVNRLKRLSFGTMEGLMDPEMEYRMESPHRKPLTGLEKFKQLSKQRHVKPKDNNSKPQKTKLLWVPAEQHPNVKPENYLGLVQETLKSLEISESARPRQTLAQIQSFKRKSSRSPLRRSIVELDDEYVDEIESLESTNVTIEGLAAELAQLSTLAGLTDDDAVTLARTLSVVTQSNDTDFASRVDCESESGFASGSSGSQLTRGRFSTYRVAARAPQKPKKVRSARMSWMPEDNAAERRLEEPDILSVAPANPESEEGSSRSASDTACDGLSSLRALSQTLTSSMQPSTQRPGIKSTTALRGAKSAGLAPAVSTGTSGKSVTRSPSTPPLTFADVHRPERPNGPMDFRASAFGFPLPQISVATVAMCTNRLPLHTERAIYRMAHYKLAQQRRPLRQQVSLTNFMYAYLNLVNYALQNYECETKASHAGVP